MLQLSKSLIGRPVLSLQTGGTLATTTGAIINPDNFKIEGLFCYDPRERKSLIVVYQDIRDIMPQGIVVNDYEALTDPQELVRLHDIINLEFNPIGMKVVTVQHQRLGKVSDYAVELETFYIQKIYVAQSMIKNFTGGNLGIDRSHIHEVTPHKIIVEELETRIPAAAGAAV